MCEKKYYLPKAQAEALQTGFYKTFGVTPERYFSAPGRTELSGNHTDHQQGRVLAGAVNLDTVAAVRENGTDVIRIQSEGYPLCQVSLRALTPDPKLYNTTISLIAGVTAKFRELGCDVRGFDAYVTSTVLPGSGLSSSAAYEVLLGTVLNGMFFENRLTQPQIAMIGQYAENVFFGKPCGLMDQMASAVGGMVTIDFADPQNPVIEKVDFDFSACGHALCIIDSRASHADLTDEYAAIPGELKALCGYFGKTVLRQVEEAAFYDAIPQLREQFGDRAVLRAIHFFEENARVPKQVASLQKGDFATYLELMKESGYSSYMQLQNVVVSGAVADQSVALSLALCRKLLAGRGGYRVHGGGFAGTVQAFVPMDMLEEFRLGMEKVLGDGACHVLSIRPEGGIEVFAE
ncbi:MAG: galactokinase [Oscillospiraceae bacterium]|nr:galactokinase [Oscillospiraceae bacterium]